MVCHALNTQSLINLESQVDLFLLIGMLSFVVELLDEFYIVWYDAFQDVNEHDWDIGCILQLLYMPFYSIY